jgi:hypothetical protein
MWTIVAPLLMCALGQAAGQPPADPRVKAIAPFVDSGVVAVMHLDLAHADFPVIVDRLSGGRSPGLIAEVSKPLTGWIEGLKGAGAKDLFVVVDVADMPGPPVVVVPLAPGANAAEIGRLLCGGGKPQQPICLPSCATLHDAVVAGTPAALDRIRGIAPMSRPELTDAFAALNDGSIGLRLLIAPSAETRRVLEETVPTLPRELGGGPTTALTRGLLWAALGLDAGAKPSLKLVVAAPDAEAARAVQRLGQDLIALAHKSPDVRAMFPELPGLAAQFKTEIAGPRLTVTADAQVAAGLIESALRPAQEAARRAQCTNNEKQIMLAMHNYASSHKLAFPPAYSTDKAGKPLLSWRVLILSYLEQDALYKEFHLDEPWDSPHNRTLIAKMPRVYACPEAKAETVREGKTRYVAPRGAGTILNGAQPVGLKDMTDGTSNTLVFVDASDERAVVWTKPDDWEVGPDLKMVPAGVLSAHGRGERRGTNCAFGDGAVRFLRETIKPATLRALLTYAGGEVIAADDF